MSSSSSRQPATRETACWGSSAADRNKGPILEVLRSVLPENGLALEISSGAGRHVVYFAAQCPGVTWQPSEPDAELRRVITATLRDARLTNIRQPVDLDVLQRPWPIPEVDAVVNINMIHVAPWPATAALLQGSAEILDNGGVLFLYGPYRRFGAHTAPSNAAFDERLRARDARWGLRDMEDVERLAGEAGFGLERRVAMPANNFSLVFRRRPRAPDEEQGAVHGG